jgi:TRAP-type C4-dicarboxylate transport system substrate-binding protein
MIESLFTSAQTGTDIQAWDNTKYFTNVGAIFSKNAVIVNGRAWQRLPADVKAVVTKAGDDFTKRAWMLSKDAHEEMAAILKKNGMMVSEAPDNVVAAMKKVGEAMTTEWKATASGDAVAALNFYAAGPKTN